MRLARAALPLLLALVAPRLAAAQSDLFQAIQALDRDPPAEYEAVMRRFVESAVKADVDGMIALTSQVTIDQLGLAAVREHYAKDTAVALRRFPNIPKGGSSSYVDDHQGTTGWIFDRVFTSEDGKRAPFRVIVLKEKGEIRVASFGLSQLPTGDAPAK